MAKKKMKIGGIQEYAGLALGAIVAGKVSNMNIPGPAIIRGLAPLALGVLMAAKGKGFVKSVGMGMVAVGGVKAVAAVAPNLGIGQTVINDYEIIEGMEDAALAGANDNMSGYTSPFAINGYAGSEGMEEFEGPQG